MSTDTPTTRPAAMVPKPVEVSPGAETEAALLERQREHFNAIAGTYAAARSGANHLLLKRLMWAHFFRRVPPPAALCPGRRPVVLEAMCGFGDGDTILKTHWSGAAQTGDASPFEYHGYDYSDRVVETVRRDRPELDVRQADATTYVPEAGRYDLIMLLGGLHHVPDAAPRVVRNLAPGLRPGGLFINLEPTHGNPVTKAVRDRIYRRNALFDERTERAFGVGELYAMFRGAGLELVEAQHPGLLSYVLYYNPDAFPNLNLGGERCVRAAFALDRPFLRTFVGRRLSFATLTLWRKPGGGAAGARA